MTKTQSDARERTAGDEANAPAPCEEDPEQAEGCSECSAPETSEAPTTTAKCRTRRKRFVL